MGSIGQIVKNTLTGWAAILIQAIVALLMVPILLGAMGKESYGLIGLFSVFIGFANVTDLGLRSALGRELAEKVTKEDRHGFRQLSTTALALYLVLAAILGTLIYVFSPQLIVLFKVSARLHDTAVQLLRIYGCIAVTTSFLTPAFSAGLTGFMRFDIVNVIRVITSLLSSILILLLVYSQRGHALHIWVYVMSFTSIVSLLAFYLAYRSICFGGVLDPSLIEPRHLTPLIALGWKMYVIQLSRTLSDKTHPIIVSYFLGPTTVAIYHSAAKLSLMFTPLVMTLPGQMYPLTTKFHTVGETENMERVLSLGTRFTLLLGGLVSAGVLIFAEPFARLWLFAALGEDYLLAARLMQIFAILDLLTYATGTQWPILLGMKRLNLLTFLSLVAALLSTALSIYFVGYTKAGVLGVLYGAIISKFLRLLVLNVHLANLIGRNVFNYYGAIYRGPAVCMASALLIGWLARRWLGCDSWTTLICAAAIVMAGWLATTFLFGVSRRDIALFRAR